MALTLNHLDVYIGLMINGLFTGIGVIVGQYIWNKYLKKRADSLHDKIRRTKKVVLELPKRRDE